MFLARAARRSLSNLFAAASAVAPAPVPSALRRPGSNPSNRVVHWSNTVEVKEIDLVKCGRCAKGHHDCKCIRRKYRYNGRMNVTFVTFASQILSEATPPSLVDRVVGYFTAEAPPGNANAAAADFSDNSSGGSKRTRYSRRATNEVEQHGNEAEEPAVEFDAVAEPFLDHHAFEAAVVARKSVRMLKELECILDGTYWRTDTVGCRTRCKPDRYSPDY